MAQARPSTFNQRATERLRGPDDLDTYVQVIFAGDASGLPEGVPFAASITTERVAPISLVPGDEG